MAAEDYVAKQLGVLVERSESTLKWLESVDAKLDQHLDNCAKKHADVDVRLARSCERRRSDDRHADQSRWVITTLIAALAVVIGWLAR